MARAVAPAHSAYDNTMKHNVKGPKSLLHIQRCLLTGIFIEGSIFPFFKETWGFIIVVYVYRKVTETVPGVPAVP